jgi:hypothetical protein
MNKLPMDKQTRVIGALVEGCSIRSIERMTGIHRDTEVVPRSWTVFRAC